MFARRIGWSLCIATLVGLAGAVHVARAEVAVDAGVLRDHVERSGERVIEQAGAGFLVAFHLEVVDLLADADEGRAAAGDEQVADRIERWGAVDDFLRRVEAEF